MEFTFTIDIDRWQRDLRTKKFVLLKRFRDRLEKFNKYILILCRMYAPVDTGTLKSAIKSRKIQNNEKEGIYQWIVYVDTSIAPHAQFHESGRRRGPAPPEKIRAWVERKLGLSGQQAFFATKAILKKLITIGFDGNIAPVKYFTQAEQAFTATYLKRLLYEIDLDVKEVFR